MCRLEESLKLGKSGRKSMQMLNRKFKKLKQLKREISSDLQHKIKYNRPHAPDIQFMTNGMFTDAIHICVMELLGLEVEIDKVSQIIRVISKHIYVIPLLSNMLPSHTTVVNIADEAHYLLYTADKIESSDHYEWSKDGTTRHKVKILENQ